jgi:hypothetical protein
MKVIVTTQYADGTIVEEEVEQDETPTGDSPSE